jgi:serine/threonine protein kinase
VALDDLAIGARAGQASARGLDLGAARVVDHARAELLLARVRERGAQASAIALLDDERGCRPGTARWRSGRCRGVEGAPGLLDARGRRDDARLGDLRIADRGREMSSPRNLGPLADLAQRTEPVAILGHGRMLHCARVANAGAAPIDRYVVQEHLSEGGMGAIYVGKKLGAGGFEMEVVLKQLLPEFTQQEEFIDLFLREAKLSATLDHANIIHTIDLVAAGGEYFIVMEYLPGGDLRTLLRKAKRRGKRFSPKAAIYISREVLSALAYAHSKRDFDGNPLKLIHRDVSPSNVLLSYQGEVKLTDFGIAKAATHTSLFYKVKGKIGYMSPEQAKSEPLDHRSDLYSVAVCLYEILTGERLFVAAGLTTSADEIYAQAVPHITRKVPGLPADFDAIMGKALAIDPAARYQTAGEFQEALMRCAHRNGLLMSAPELATELREACGPTEQWRGDEDDDLELGFVAGMRAGTEVLPLGLDDEDDADDEADDELQIAPSGPLSIHAIAARVKAPTLPPPFAGKRPATEIEKFHGMELTSIINMIDIEHAGAKPLVDLDVRAAAPPVLDPAPPSRPSGTRRAVLAPPLPPLPPPMPRMAQPHGQPYPPPPDLSRPQRYPSDTPARSGLRSWVVIIVILLVAGAVALVVALSGPSVAAGN